MFGFLIKSSDCPLVLLPIKKKYLPKKLIFFVAITTEKVFPSPRIAVNTYDS